MILKQIYKRASSYILTLLYPVDLNIIDIPQKNLILHIIHSDVNEHTAGTEIITDNIAKGIKEFNHAVLYIGSQKTQIRIVTKLTDKVFEIKNFLQKDYYKLNDPAFNLHIKKILQKLKPSIVHIQSMHGYPISLIQTLIESKTKIILHMHEFDIFYPLPGTFKLQDKNIIEDVERIINETNYTELDRTQAKEYSEKRLEIIKQLWNKIDYIIAVHEFVERELIRAGFGHKNLVTIENGMSTASIKGINDFDPTKEKLKVGWIGSFAKHKGAELFADLIKQDRSSIFNWKIVGATDNATAEYLNYTKDLEVTGKYDHKDLQKLIEDIDIVIIPSIIAETYSLVLSEALLSHKYILTSNLGAIGFRMNIISKENVIQIENFVELCWKKLVDLNSNRKVISRFLQKDLTKNIRTDEEMEKEILKIYREIV